MTNLIVFMKAHPTALILGLYYVMSAAIGSLPMPDADSHKFYRWFFQFANTLAANVTRAYASKLPSTSSEEKKPPAV